MSENGRQQPTKCIVKLVLTLSVIVLVTIIVITFMFVWTDMATTITLVSTSHGPMDIDREHTMVNTPSERIPVNLSMTGPVTKQDYNDLQNNEILGEKMGVKYNSSVKLMSPDSDAVSNDNFGSKSSIPWRTSMPFIDEGKSKNGNNRIGMISDLELYELIKRQSNPKKISRNDQRIAEIEKLIPEEDTSTSYHNSYDLTYNAGDYGYKENDVYDIGSATLGGSPEQPYFGAQWSGRDKWEGTYYQQPVHPMSSPDQYNNYPIHSKENPLTNWKIFSLLALLKLGFIKLHAIGVINLLFFLLVKLKIFMVAMFLKSIVVKKLMTLYKSLVVPLLFLQLLPMFVQLLALNAQSMSRILMPTTTTAIPVTNRRTTTSRQIILDNSGTGTSLNGGSNTASVVRPGSSMTGTVLTDSMGVPADLTGGLNDEGSLAGLPNGMTKMSGPTSGLIHPGINELLFHNVDDLNLLGGKPINQQNILDPTLDIYQKILDSEKCTERIACRIAVTEKAGIMPHWVNWMLRRASNFIPVNELDTYVQTYKDVIKEIYTMKSKPKSWITWCSERYDCDIEETE